jgi:amylosucrase
MNWELARQAQEPETVPGRIFRGLKQLEQLRREKQAFSTRADFWTWDTGSDRVLGLGRWLDGQLLLGLFNFAPEQAAVKLDDLYADLLTGELRNGIIQLPGYGFAWLEQEL